MAQKGAPMKGGIVWIPVWELWRLLCRCLFLFSSLFVVVEGSFLESFLGISQSYLDLSDQQRALDAQMAVYIANVLGYTDHRRTVSLLLTKTSPYNQMDFVVWALMICSGNSLKISEKTSYQFFPTSI